MAKVEIKLSELPFGKTIEINGYDYEYKGCEKRRTQFGNQEHFVFYCKTLKNEKIFEKYKFSTAKIKKDGEKYYW